MKILFISSPHNSGAIEGPAKLILAGFKSLGHEVTHINASKDQNQIALINLLESDDFDLIFTLNIRVLLLRKYFTKIFKLIKCPIAIFLLDHPAYHIDGIKKILPNINQKILTLSPDEIHQVVINNYINKYKLCNASAIFFPWAAPIETFNNDIPDRKYDIVCFSSLNATIENNITKKEFIEKLGKSSAKAYFEYFFERIIYEDLTTPLEIHFEKGIGEALDIGSNYLCKIYAELDSLTKKFRRHIFAKQILNATSEMSLKICVCGTGWEQLAIKNPKLSVLGNIDYMQQFELYRNSKILINIDPNWTCGIHDRVFNALACGTSVITNENKYSLNIPFSSEKIKFYKSIGEIPEKIRILTQQKFSQNNLELKNENWTSRAKILSQQIFNKL